MSRAPLYFSLVGTMNVALRLGCELSFSVVVLHELWAKLSLRAVPSLTLLGESSQFIICWFCCWLPLLGRGKILPYDYKHTPCYLQQLWMEWVFEGSAPYLSLPCSLSSACHHEYTYTTHFIQSLHTTHFCTYRSMHVYTHRTWHKWNCPHQPEQLSAVFTASNFCILRAHPSTDGTPDLTCWTTTSPAYHEKNISLTAYWTKIKSWLHSLFCSALHRQLCWWGRCS